MDRFLNLSAYRFVALVDPPHWREQILGHAAGLKGTVLLAEEGINLFLAGPPGPLRGFVTWLRAQAPFAGLETKESWSDDLPFRRLKVKVRREIIRMNHPAIRPQQQRAPLLDAPTLARWLDSGRDDAGRAVVTLDTRNAFEVDAGRFKGAIDWRLARFSDFPAAVQARAGSLAGKTVVSYCTGGIRCEKAALVLQEAGVESVFQLDGGILRYFEQTGGRHFEGRCFVFDERELLDTALQPAGPA